MPPDVPAGLIANCHYQPKEHMTQMTGRIHSNHPALIEIMRLIGLPGERCQRFILDVKADEYAIVTAEFFPEPLPQGEDWEPVMKSFDLVERP